MMDVSPKVIEIIAREQHLDVNKITPDSTFAELGIDSLDGVNILFALEEEFKLDIPDTVAQNMKSVRQLIQTFKGLNVRRVVITGIGVFASTGKNANSFNETLVNGRSAIRRIQQF